jgi:hypothetical protein
MLQVIISAPPQDGSSTLAQYSNGCEQSDWRWHPSAGFASRNPASPQPLGVQRPPTHALEHGFEPSEQAFAQLAPGFTGQSALVTQA